MEGMKVVVKKNGSWCGGHVVDGKFKQNRRIRTLASMRDRDEYVTLAFYLKNTGNKMNPEVILSKFKAEKVYVAYKGVSAPLPVATATPKPAQNELKGKVDIKRFEKQWWAKFHPTCVSCTKGCKQSHMMLSVYCPSRQVKNNKK